MNAVGSVAIPRYQASFGTAAEERWGGSAMPEKLQRVAERRAGRGAARTAWAAVGLLALGAGIAAGQTLGPEPAPPPTENAALPSPEKPGFISAFGSWMQQGVANMGAGFGAMVGTIGGRTSEAAKGAADAATGIARDTATTVTRLPATRIIGGRERCVLAPNGAPDCRIAAEVLCRAKGYGSGTSVDFETDEKCPPPYRLSSRNTPEGVCTMEHFVIRALCQ
jgi:hypothetical protein